MPDSFNLSGSFYPVSGESVHRLSISQRVSIRFQGLSRRNRDGLALSLSISQRASIRFQGLSRRNRDGLALSLSISQRASIRFQDRANLISGLLEQLSISQRASIRFQAAGLGVAAFPRCFQSLRELLSGFRAIDLPGYQGLTVLSISQRASIRFQGKLSGPEGI